MYIYYLSLFIYIIHFIISQISTPFAASKAGSFSRFKRLACCPMYEKRPLLQHFHIFVVSSRSTKGRAK